MTSHQKTALKHWKPKPVYDHTHTVAILVPLVLLFIGNRTQDYFETLKDSPLQGQLITLPPLAVLPGVS